MPSIGDKVIVMPSLGENVAIPIETPEVGDSVILYALKDNSQIAVPTLDFSLDNQVFVSPSFNFAGFNWDLDFDFNLLFLELEKFIAGDYYYGNSWDWTDGWEMTFSEWGSTMWSGGVDVGTYSYNCPAGFTSGRLWIYAGGHCRDCGAYVSMKKTFTGPASGLKINMACRVMYHWYIYLNGVLIYNHAHTESCTQFNYMFGETLRDFELELKLIGDFSEVYGPYTAYGWVSALYFYE